MKEKFTRALYDLMVEKDLTLKESLEIIAASNISKIGKIGNYLLEEILKGGSLSNSMSRCPYVDFDETYIAFINLSESTGQLRESITYLKDRLEREKERKFKLIEVGIYPSLVVLLAGVGCLILISSDLFKIDNKILIYLFLLIIASICIFIAIKNAIGENKIYEAFFVVGLLLRSGINLYDAINCGAQILGVNTKNGMKFQKAGEKLLLGMDIEKAFSLGKKYTDAFFFANKGGGKADVFEKLAKWIGDKDEKKRTICLSLIEPIFIFITGVFLLILVANIFMPFITSLSVM